MMRRWHALEAPTNLAFPPVLKRESIKKTMQALGHPPLAADCGAVAHYCRRRDRRDTSGQHEDAAGEYKVSPTLPALKSARSVVRAPVRPAHGTVALPHLVRHADEAGAVAQLTSDMELSRTERRREETERREEMASGRPPSTPRRVEETRPPPLALNSDTVVLPQAEPHEEDSPGGASSAGNPAEYHSGRRGREPRWQPQRKRRRSKGAAIAAARDVFRLSAINCGYNEADRTKVILRGAHISTFLQDMQIERDDAAVQRLKAFRAAGELQRQMARDHRQHEAALQIRREEMAKERARLDEEGEEDEEEEEELGDDVDGVSPEGASSQEESRSSSISPAGFGLKRERSARLSQVSFPDSVVKSVMAVRRSSRFHRVPTGPTPKERVIQCPRRLAKKLARVARQRRKQMRMFQTLAVEERETLVFAFNQAFRGALISPIRRSKSKKNSVSSSGSSSGSAKNSRSASPADYHRRDLDQAVRRGNLDMEGLSLALSELGLQAKTSAETQSTNNIITEVYNDIGGRVDFYAFQAEIVPRVRERFRELRHGHYLHGFNVHDCDRSGSIDRVECLEILQKQFLWRLDEIGSKLLQNGFNEHFNRLGKGSDELPFDAYEQLFSWCDECFQRTDLMRRRDIISTEGLNAYEAELHKDEITYLFGMYSLYITPNAEKDQEKSTVTPIEDIRHCLVETGLLPRCQNYSQMLEEAYAECTRFNQQCTFKIVLHIIRKIRGDIMRSMRDECSEAFRSFDTDGSGFLTFKEISVLASQFGLEPRCREEQDVLRRLLHNADADGNGEFELEEFQAVVQLMGEQLRGVQCFEERLLAEELNIPRQTLSAIRDIYRKSDHDENNELDLTEMKSAMTALRCPLRGRHLHDFLKNRQPPAGTWTLKQFLTLHSQLSASSPPES